MKIVVTGGTGYLGGRLVEALEGQGRQVTVVSRSRGHDVRRPDTLEDVFRDADAVFHLAALVQSRPGSFEDVNIAGLLNVLEACRKQAVRRLICVSSFTVFGPSAGRPHREDSIPTRTHFFHGYDRTKYEAWRTAREWKDRIPLNIVFPTVIYGPGALTEGNITARLLQRWARMHVAPLPDGGRPIWNYVYVEDVAQGLIQTLGADPGEDFILGGENVSLRRLCERFAEVAGVRILPAALPALLFKAGAYAEDWGSRILGFPPLVLPSTADFFLNDWEFSCDLAKTEIGYAPRRLSAGLELTHRWMKEQKLL